MPNPTKKVQIVGEVLKSFVRNDIEQELTEEQKAQARSNIGAAGAEDVTASQAALEERVAANEWFIERDKYLFNPIVNNYEYDGRTGHKYDFYSTYWQSFPETIELNTPVLLYDLSAANDDGCWNYNEFESNITDGIEQYRIFKLYFEVIFGSNRILSTKDITKDIMVEIGTGNFKIENTGYTIYSIIDLSTLTEEYTSMFTSIGVYYVKTAESMFGRARPVWECAVGLVEEFMIPETIARTADVNASLETKLPSPETAAVGQFVKVSAVDDTGKVTATEAVDEPDEDDALELVTEMGLVDPMTDESGNVLTDENGILFTL